MIKKKSLSLSSVVIEAERWARFWHHGQVRKYTGDPYVNHCAEIVEILRTIPHTDDMLAAAWLHDVLEDTECTWYDMCIEFGADVTGMVSMLTDCDKSVGNRSVRKMVDRLKLAMGTAEVQTIKLADLISNTSSIMQHDPKFAKVYLAEARLLLEVLTKGDASLRERLVRILTVPDNS